MAKQIEQLLSLLQGTLESTADELKELEADKADLEKKVTERTQDLLQINEALLLEIQRRHQTELALRESEQRFRFLSEFIPQQVWTAKPDGKLNYFNQRCLDYLGKTAEQLQDLGWQEVLHPDDLPRCLELWQHSLKTGEPYEIEFRLQAGDGTYRWHIGRALPLRDRQGNIITWFGTNTCIEERKQAEAALQKANEQLEIRVQERTAELQQEIAERQRFQEELEKSLSLLSSTLEATGEAIIVSRDARDIVIFNQKFAEMWSIPASIMASGDLAQVLPFLLEQLKEPDAFLCQAKDLFSQPEADGYSIFELKDGRVIERYSQPQWLGNKVVGRVCTFRDISDRLQVEATLRESQERFQQLAETIPEAFWIANATLSKILYLSPAYEQIWGRSLESFYEQPTAFMDSIYPEDREQVFSGIQTIIQGETLQKEYRIVRPDGSIRWIWDRAFPVKDQQGQVERICGLAQDITERKLAEAALRKSEATNRALLNAIPDLMIRMSGDGTCLDFIPAKDFRTIQPCSEMRGKNLFDILPLDIAQQRMHYIKQALSTGETQVYELQLSWEDGSVSYEEARIVVSGHNEVLVIVRDISDRKQAEMTIHYQATHDLLTGLPNRSLFSQRLLEALEKAQKSDYILAIMFLDLDRFKIINDTLGHAAGDRLLQSVAKRVAHCLRQDDTLARWGGDEFTLLLPEIRQVEDAAAIAQRILDALKPSFNLEDRQLHISSSIGIALYDCDGFDADTLLRNADVALYRAKEQGRNNYQFYATHLNSQASELLILENELYQALKREEFVVYYQPQINITTGQILGMEALVRWQHPELGLVSPAKFIPIAEETGLIVPIGEWVLKTACLQNKSWQNAGINPVRVAVNLSARQFQQPQFVEIVAKILSQTELEAQFLELEITETIAMQDREQTCQLMSHLHEMGVHLSIDDFGTGYSSLGYLKNFPLNSIKIDKSFVHDLTTNLKDAAIINAVMILGQGLNLRVVAEGVETEGQKEALINLNCHYMQGYLFSHPLSPEDASQLLYRTSCQNRVQLCSLPYLN